MYSRDRFNAIVSNIPPFIPAVLADLEKLGAWETGIETDRRGRGCAINTAVYGIDCEQQLAVIQVRESVFRPGRFTRVRKNYFLVGRTESGNAFAHAVDSPARSSLAMSDAKFCVDYVLAKIWQVKITELPDIERQGDVAFIPVRSIPETATPVNGPITIRESHVLTGDTFRDIDGTYYTRRGAKLTHTKHQHAAVKAKAGYYRVQAGYRASTWQFALEHGD